MNVSWGDFEANSGLILPNNVMRLRGQKMRCNRGCRKPIAIYLIDTKDLLFQQLVTIASMVARHNPVLDLALMEIQSFLRERFVKRKKARTEALAKVLRPQDYFAPAFCAVAVSVPRRERRGKNGVSSNGILSRTDVYETGAALIISTLSSHGSSLILPPRGRAAI